MTWRKLEPPDAGRTLQNGSHRLLQNNGRRDSELIYDRYRLTEDMCRRGQQQSGKMTETCLLRCLENGNTRLIEDPGKCVLSVSDLVVTVQIVNHVAQASYTVNISCGPGSTGYCIAYYQAYWVLPLYPPPSKILWTSPCYQLAEVIQCGTTVQASGDLEGQAVSGGWYRCEIAVWNSQPCPSGAWPVAYTCKNIQIPVY
jgi:hypothetical protein